MRATKLRHVPLGAASVVVGYPQQSAGDEFGDLHRVQGCTLAEVVADHPERDPSGPTECRPEPAGQHLVDSRRIDRRRHLV